MSRQKTAVARPVEREYATDRKVWEIQDWESGSAYGRFAVYLGIGPLRTADLAFDTLAKSAMDKAFKDHEDDLVKAQQEAEKAARRPMNANRSQWRSECLLNRWEERASRFDAAQLILSAELVVSDYAKILARISHKLLKALEHLEPADWRQAMETLNVLGQTIPPETFAAALDHARNAGNGLVLEQPRPLLQGPGRVHQERIEDQPDTRPGDVLSGPDDEPVPSDWESGA